MSSPPSRLEARCLAEACGAFLLVFFGTGAILADRMGGGLGTVGIGLVFGLAVYALASALGPVSGAHMNPAVTAALCARGLFPRRELLPYTLSQLAGACLASLALALMLGKANGLGATLPSGSAAQSFALEFVMTAALLLAILGTAGTGQTALAAGATVGLEAIMGGPISGASMNPARSFGPALLLGDFTAHWVYWAGPLLGALAGAAFHGFISRGK